MKQKKNAKEKRAEESRKRKEHWNQDREAVPSALVPAPFIPAPAAPLSKKEKARMREEETREFLEYLKKDIRIVKEEPEDIKRKTTQRKTIGTLNLESGMPMVEEALSRMNIGLQEMRVSGIKVVRLIHGYGSTGRGGKICAGVREELASMKRKRLIRDYIPGEDFSPMDSSSRKLAETEQNITRDPDYGRVNHGITMVVL